MTVYVDELKDYQKNVAGHGSVWCHLFSDDVEELHAFAGSLGLKRSWFQNRPRFPHYDLVPSKRALAVKKGAVQVTRDEMVNLMHKLNEVQQGGLHGTLRHS
jgi:hypothetical protein